MPYKLVLQTIANFLFFIKYCKKAAQLTVEGLWLDLNLRKATIPPDFLQKICAEMPKTANFEWLKGRK